MRALYSVSNTVPAARVIREHRAALIPLGIVLAVNVVVLIVVVLPLLRSVNVNDERALAAARAEESAASGFRRAEAERDGKSRATADLATFYKQVLPADVVAARRITDVKLQQLARKHGVAYERGSMNPEEIRDSSLERLVVTANLTGDYDDIRALIYDLETASDFVVIDNIVLAEGSERGSTALALTLELSTYYRAPRLPGGRSGPASAAASRFGTAPSMSTGDRSELRAGPSTGLRAGDR